MNVSFSSFECSRNPWYAQQTDFVPFLPSMGPPSQLATHPSSASQLVVYFWVASARLANASLCSPSDAPVVSSPEPAGRHSYLRLVEQAGLLCPNLQATERVGW